MSRKLSIRKRVERLEAVLAKPGTAPYREARVVLGDFEGEGHLVMTSSPEDPCCWFQEMPGPGPQLADFGKFALVLHFTSAEAGF
jgi:hypothetical protein